MHAHSLSLALGAESGDGRDTDARCLSLRAYVNIYTSYLTIGAPKKASHVRTGTSWLQCQIRAFMEMHRPPRGGLAFIVF